MYGRPRAPRSRPRLPTAAINRAIRRAFCQPRRALTQTGWLLRHNHGS